MHCHWRTRPPLAFTSNFKTQELHFHSINSMGLCLLFCLLLLLPSAFHLQTCPSPFSTNAGKCLYYISDRTNWCDAQRQCFSNGGELITGDTFLDFFKNKEKRFYQQYWIGLTDLRHERKSNPTGWQWTNGSEMLPDTDVQWGSNEPGTGGGTDDCVFVDTDKLYDNGCHAKAPWLAPSLCQPRQAREDFREALFKQATISYGEKEEFYSNQQCDHEILDVKSSVVCAAMCHQQKDAWCVSFYFSKAQRRCLLVLFADANVKRSSEEGWVKFAQQIL